MNKVYPTIKPNRIHRRVEGMAVGMTGFVAERTHLWLCVRFSVQGQCSNQGEKSFGNLLLDRRKEESGLW